MSLLVFEIPLDKLEYLEERINTFKSKLETLPHGDAKEAMVDRYTILEKFVQFLQKDVDMVENFELTNRGFDKRSAANIEISLALSKPGNATYLSDEHILAKVTESLYKGSDNAPQALFYETAFPLVFEWWETEGKTEEDEWKGVIKIPKSFVI